MINKIRYENNISDVNWGLPSIFLAGPTVRGNQPHLQSWRNEALFILEENAFNGNVIIPEFVNKTESDKYRYDLPGWEFEGLIKSDVIVFWIPRTRQLIGLTTNFEFGYWMAKDRSKIVYGRPDDAYRIAYTDIMWVEDSLLRNRKDSCPIYNTLQKTIQAALDLLVKQHPKPRIF